MQTLTNWALAHKRTVVVLWTALAIAGLWAGGQVTDAVDDQFSMPDSAAFATNERIEERFGNGGRVQPLVAVAELPDGTTVDSPGVRGDLRALERELRDAIPGARIASYGSTPEDAYVSDDGRTTFAVVHPPVSDEGGPGSDEADAAVVDAARAVATDAKVGGADVMITGEAALANEPEEAGGDGGPEFLSETLIAGVGALAVLAFVFASALALVPLVIAAVAIPTTLLAVLGLTELTTVSFIVVFLVSLIGLGIAVDYALIVVMRWREERERGRTNEDSIRAAVATAGRAVLFSGTTVAVGLMAAVVLPIPFLQSMGYGGLLIPLVSVAVALTLLPVVLATIGPRADRRRLRRTDRADRHWARWATLVVRHRVGAAIAGAAVLLALCVVATGMTLGEPEADALGGTGDAKRALEALEDSGIGASPLTPIEVLTPASQAADTAARLASVDGVRAASSPGWTTGDQAVVNVFTAEDSNSGPGRDATAAVVDAASGMPSVGVGGETAVVLDWVDSVYGSFPIMVGLISLVTFVLLARAFRSIVLPLKAIAMNLLSVFATWGVMTLVWQHGFGTDLLFGTDATGSVAFWAPMIVFAFIYGLSMDYEVFILARIREEYDRHGSTDQAVVRGIGSTGRLVTSAALIVFLAFGSMGLEGDIDVQMLATGLGAGVLLDALVVRSLLVPATVSWLGRWNWWMPERGRKILRIDKPDEPALDHA